MSTEWYCQVFGQELGPIAFDELSDMVCRGTLSMGDLVRSARSDEWQRTDSIPELVLVSGRNSLTLHAKSANPPLQTVATPAAIPFPTMNLASPVSLPSPQAQMLAAQVSMERVASFAQEPLVVPPRQPEKDSFSSVDVATTKESSKEWRATIRAALEQRRGRSGSKFDDGTDAEIQKDENESAGVGLTGLIGTGWFYIVAALLAIGNLCLQSAIWLLHATVGRLVLAKRFGQLVAETLEVIGYLIEDGDTQVRKLIVRFSTACSMISCSYLLWSWSSREEMRFPSRRPELASPIFPVIGPCGEMEYWFLFVNTVAVIGIATCCCAVWLVKRAK